MQVSQITLRAVILKSRPSVRGQAYRSYRCIRRSRLRCEVFETLGTKIFSTRITVVSHNRTRPTTMLSNAVNDSPGTKSDNPVHMIISRTTITDRKSTRLTSSHVSTSYADFCL